MHSGIYTTTSCKFWLGALWYFYHDLHLILKLPNKNLKLISCFYIATLYFSAINLDNPEECFFMIKTIRSGRSDNLFLSCLEDFWVQYRMFIFQCGFSYFPYLYILFIFTVYFFRFLLISFSLSWNTTFKGSLLT